MLSHKAERLVAIIITTEKKQNKNIPVILSGDI